MDQKQIDRINELARKARTPEGLTEWERMEQAALRREYIDSVLGNLKSQLDHTYVVDAQCTQRKRKQKQDCGPWPKAKKSRTAWSCGWPSWCCLSWAHGPSP